MSNPYWLTEEQMARLRPYFPKSHGKPRVEGRRVLSGIVFVNRDGLRWCDAPQDRGPRKTLHNRWKRRGEKGIKARIPGRESRSRPVKYDKRRHRGRSRIEMMFGRLKDWRRVATRYDRCPAAFMAAVHLAATAIFRL